MDIKNGWYFVEIHNPIPKDDEVSSFVDWVEYADDGWDMAGIERFKIGKIIREEKALLESKVND
jgi:hypothetical protein